LRELSPRGRESRLRELHNWPGDSMISTEDAAVLMGVGLGRARAYKAVGIISPVNRLGAADIYSLSEIRLE